MTMTDKLLQNPAALCNMVRRVAVEAGHLTLKYFDGEFDNPTDEKHDGSPVTLADREAEKFIVSALRDITPEIPIIAEEGTSGAVDLSGQDCFWLVDPLDATKEFIAGGENYTVNIGLVQKGMPTLGVIFAPALGTLYAGHSGKAVRWNETTGKDKDISVRQTPAAGLTVMSSLYHAEDGKMHAFLESFKVEKILKKPSSLKICAVAEGKADMYPRFGPTCEWDIAAGEAILRAAGGVFTDIKGAAMEYGRSDRKFENPFFVAAAFDWCAGEEL